MSVICPWIFLCIYLRLRTKAKLTLICVINRDRSTDWGLSSRVSNTTPRDHPFVKDEICGEILVINSFDQISWVHYLI
jgi:hypothetical protein